jgi:hypothetical protein
MNSRNSYKPQSGLCSIALKKSVVYTRYNQFKNGQDLPEDRHSSTQVVSRNYKNISTVMASDQCVTT